MEAAWILSLLSLIMTLWLNFHYGPGEIQATRVNIVYSKTRNSTRCMKALTYLALTFLAPGHKCDQGL